MFDDGPRRFGDPWPHGTLGRYPPRQRTVGPHVRRLGVVYGIAILDPATGQVRIDYVGLTRDLRRREAEHRVDQPFGDLIVGGLVVIEQGVWTDAELDARETCHIATVRPRYNYLKNEGNPARIPIWLAQEQRWVRDDAAGRPRWVPPQQREGVSRAVRLRESPQRAYRWPGWLLRLRRRVAARAVRGVRVAAVWLALAGGVLLVIPDTVAAGTAAGRAALAATAVTGLGWRLVQPGRRRRRRRR